jgi:hypothetical protein
MQSRVGNPKINNVREKQQPNVLPLMQKPKEEAELISWQLKSK